MSDKWQLKAVLSARDEMSPQLKRIADAAKNTRKYLGDVGKSAVNLAGHVGLPLAMLSGAATALSVAGLKRAVTGFAELGDEVHKSAQRIGVSIQDYQRLKYVAGQSGVSVEELSSSMGRLNKGIAEAAAGKNKDLAALLAKAGISMRDANGQLRSASDMLPELAELFSRNGNAAVQARMGNAVFGKSWQALAPLLQSGKAGIDELNARYRQLGIAVEDDAILAGEKFGDQMDDLHQVVSSYGNTITTKLLPALSPMIEKVIQWAVANRDLIATKVSKFVTELADSLSKVDWAAVMNGIGSIVSSIRSFVNMIGGARNALIALVIVMNAQAIMATAQLTMSLFRLGMFLWGPLIAALGGVLSMIKVVWAVFAANPIGLVIAAVAALAIIIYKHWDGIVEYVSGAWERIKSVFDVGFFGGLFHLWLEGWQAFGNGILGIIKSIVPDFLLPDALKNFEFSFASEHAAKVTNEAGGSLSGNGPSLVNAGKVQASGQISVSFDNAPPGMRVEQSRSTGDVPIDTNVGYRSFALGMA